MDLTGDIGSGIRPGLRWLLTLVVASTLCFMIYLYHSETYLHSSSTLLQHLIPNPAQIDSDAPANTPTSPSEGLRRTPWVDTPKIFDITHVSGYVATSAVPDRALRLHPRLADAMSRFLARPILTHEQARQQNQAACPLSQLDSQVNADQLGGEHAKWTAVDVETAVQMRQGALEYLEQHSKSEGDDSLIGPGMDPDGQAVVKGSRGIVFTAGNHATVDKAIVCIKEMRKLGWQHGGFEVFHFEDEMKNEEQRKELEKLGATPRMVTTKKKKGQWKNFELKAEAILRSSFDQVLYLDSDNYPLSDVSALFDAPLFQDTRGGNAVFWPDLNRDHPDNAIHRLLGIPCHDAWELDSGQLLIAKSGNDGLNLAALYLAQYMAEEGGYWFSGGDKDTFRYAFLALGIPYTPAPRWLSLLGNPDPRGDFCGAAMLQHGITPPRPGYADPADPSHPEPLFVHANLLKHMHGVRPGDVFALLQRLYPTQDDVRVDYPPATALHSVAGGGAEVPGRGLCSHIKVFRAGADVETSDAKMVFGGLMKDFETEYFGYGGTPGVWR